MTKSLFQIETKKSNFHVSVGNITQTEIPKLAFLRLMGTDFNINEMNGQLQSIEMKLQVDRK